MKKATEVLFPNTNKKIREEIKEIEKKDNNSNNPLEKKTKLVDLFIKTNSK